MDPTDYTTVVSHYRIRDGKLDSFIELLGRRWITHRDLELATDTPPQYFVDDQQPVDPSLVIEIFEWSSPSAVARAHTHPAVSTMWEQMNEMFAVADDKPHREHFTVRTLAVAH
ncbi:MAG: hypothetical protein M3063_04415 [Actinomycetota bacterium]|nr:hypothetical protein [Actinomycetota bacterium]